MDTVISTHSDVPSAMHRDDVGDIDFIWGTPGTGKNFKHGMGISHIIAKRNSEANDGNNHGEEVARKLVEVLAKGTSVKQQFSRGKSYHRILITYDGHTAVLIPKDGTSNAWILTGWDIKEEASTSATSGVNDPYSATSTTPTRTRSSGAIDASSTSTIDEPSKKVNGSMTGEKSNAGKKGAKAPKEEKPDTLSIEYTDYEKALNRIVDDYMEGKLDLEEALDKIADEAKKQLIDAKTMKEQTALFMKWKATHSKLTRIEFSKKYSPKSESELEEIEKSRTDEEIKNDKKAKRLLGAKLYNEVYRQAVAVLRGHDSVRGNAYEVGIIYSKLCASFKKNYGIDAPFPFLSLVEPRHGGYNSDTLGEYSPLENSISIANWGKYPEATVLLHEGAHWYDSMLQQFASLSDAEIKTYFGGNIEEAKKSIDKIREDLKAIDDWANFDEDKVSEYTGTTIEDEFKGYQRLAHYRKPAYFATRLRGYYAFRTERFSRGFQEYLLNGKTKSKGLAHVFKHLKDWMIYFFKTKEAFMNAPLPEDMQRIYDSMINGNRNEKAGMNKTSTDNEKVKRSTESNAPHDVGTINSDTIRESVSKPLYQVTNRELSASDEIKVVDITGSPGINALRDNDGGKELIKSLEGKEFSFIGGTGYVSWIDKKALDGENERAGHEVIHSNLRNKSIITDETRERALTNLDDIFDNCVYVDKHPDYRHQKGTDYIELFCPVKDGNEFFLIHLVARERGDNAGRYKVGKALLYNLYKNKKAITPRFVEKIQQTKGGNGFYRITIADLLNDVKDRKGQPYVVNGELNYDENIFMTKEMLEYKIQKEKFMKDMETSVVKKFPNVKNVSSTVTHVTFDMPNGSHIDMNTYRDKIYIKPDANSENVEVVNREDLLTLSKEGFDEVPSYAAFELAMSNLSQRERNALNRNFKDVKSIAKAYRQWQVARMNNDGTLYGKTFQRIQDTANSFLKLFAENDKAIISKVKEGKVWESEKNNKSAEKLSNILDKSLEEPLNQMVDISTLKGKVKGKIKETVKGKDHNNDHITVREREK